MNLYERIESLCKEHGINITQMCRETGLTRAKLSDLKMGRTRSLAASALSKIAGYFGVSVDYLLGEEQKKAGRSAAISTLTSRSISSRSISGGCSNASINP